MSEVRVIEQGGIEYAVLPKAGAVNVLEFALHLVHLYEEDDITVLSNDEFLDAVRNYQHHDCVIEVAEL